MKYKVMYKNDDTALRPTILEDTVNAHGFTTDTEGTTLWKWGRMGDKETIAFYDRRHLVRVLEVQTMKQSRKFILEQARALAALGYSEADIARTIKWVEKHMPADANERTWVPTAQDLQDETLDDAAIEDALQAWRRSRSIPRRYNNLLGAMSEGE